MALLIDTQIRNDLYATGSIEAGGGFTGSLQGTSSYAFTASFALNGGGAGTSLGTGSTYPITSSWATNAITATTSTNVGIGTINTNKDFSVTFVDGTSGNLPNLVSSTFFLYNPSTNILSTTASNALSASYALSSSYVLSSSYSITSSYSLTASYISGALTHVEKGVISGSDFSGNPKTFSVNYILPFNSTIYVYSVVATEPRIWSVITETTGSIINSNSNQELNGFVYYRIEEI